MTNTQQTPSKRTVRVKAVILAGGQGSRFKPYTDLIPKPMIPLGEEEKPLLEYIVEWLTCHGIHDIVFLVGYRWRQIYNYFRNGDRHGAHITYSHDDPKYKGTGGALLKAHKTHQLDNADVLLIWYGDILAPLDVNALLNKHITTQSTATIATAPRYQVPVGIVETNPDSTVRQIREKPTLAINTGIGILTLNPQTLENTEKHLGTNFDIMTHFLPYLLQKGYKVTSYTHNKWWIDVGSLEKYTKINQKIITKQMKCLRKNKFNNICY